MNNPICVADFLVGDILRQSCWFFEASTLCLGAQAHAIIQLFEQPDLRYRMGQAARLLVDRKITWDRVVRPLIPILDSVVCQLSVPLCFTLQERMSV